MKKVTAWDVATMWRLILFLMFVGAMYLIAMFAVGVAMEIGQ